MGEMADFLTDQMIDSLSFGEACKHGYDGLCPVCDKDEVKRIEKDLNKKARRVRRGKK